LAIHELETNLSSIDVSLWNWNEPENEYEAAVVVLLAVMAVADDETVHVAFE
jgi:hypothetical protein